MPNKLKAYHGDFNEKLIQLSKLSKWLKVKQIPKSAVEITEALFNPTREFKGADCAVEDFTAYPKILGLPLWLGRLNGTIDHHNSKSFDFNNEGYEFTYYKEFLLSCKEGVDYSGMLYPWQLFLLEDFIPGVAGDKLIKEIIDLHKNAMAGGRINKQEWRSAQKRLEDQLNELKEYKSPTYHLRRTAFLSVEEVIDIANLWTSSAEAAANAKIRYILDGPDVGEESVVKDMVWKEIRDSLLKMLSQWH